jgi:2-polyprenyl-3-methyl-5-hydroxy-6-metoxy-1,4-benzoquinol methylase
MTVLAPDHKEKVAQAFESPDWYLRRFAVNIRIRVETLMEMVHPRPAAEILDVGCGDGSLSLPFLERGARITFLDRSQTMLNIVDSRIPAERRSQARMLRSDFFGAELEPGSYDVIICVGVLAYVPNLEAFLARVKSLLRPEGMLVLEFTNAGHFLSALSQFYGAVLGVFKKPPFVTFKRGKREVMAAVESAGFEVRGLFEYTFWLPLLSRVVSQESCYRLVRRLFGWYPANRRASLGNECIMAVSMRN